MKELRDFYVYVLLDTRESGNFEFGGFEFSNKPFYVGKGRKDRWKAHFGKRKKKQNQHLFNKIQAIRNVGLEPDICIISNYFNEFEAYQLEKYLIKHIGLDILTNKAPGGIGVGAGTLSGDRNPTKDPEVSKKISQSCMGRVPWNKGKSGYKMFSEEQRKKLSEDRKGISLEQKVGKDRAEQIRLKMSEIRKGNLHSEESKKKMSDSSLFLSEEKRKSRKDGIMRYRNNNYIEIYQSNAMSVNYMSSLGFTDNQISISLGITRVMVKRIIRDVENFMEM